MTSQELKDFVSPVTITWQNISVSVKQKILLNQSQGYCKPGQMLAIMGPSGAGKTTLLSLLSQRIDPNFYIEGRILANGFPYNQKSFYKFGTYVYQNDLLMQTLTVKETLQFSALLKIQNKEKAKLAVDQLITEFQLQKCQDTYVGGLFLKGISGGQKKRVCIAIQMVARPSVIILDQPTSGLDSNKAARVLTILKKFADNGHTIIFTIHQPSYLQYVKLNRLILLNYGQVIYQGLASNMFNYLQSIGIKVNKKSTISDFFMMEISTYKQIQQNYSTPFNKQNYHFRIQSQIKKQIIEYSYPQNQNFHIPLYIQTFSYMFVMLCKRNIRNYWRNFMKFGANILTAFLRVIFIGILFLNWIPSREIINSSPYIQFIKIQSLAFLCATSNILMAMFAVSLSIPFERQLYYKEVDSKKYTPFPYFISKIIVQFTSALVGTTIYSIIGYWENGFTRTFSKFIVFYFIMILMTLAGNSIGFFCGTLFRQVNRVSAMTPIILIPLMLVSGLFNKLDAIPSYISWLQYVSPYRYGWHMVLLNQFGDEKFLNGSFNYKEQLGINSTIQQNILLLLALCLGFYICSYMMLLKFTKRIVA